MDSAVFFIGGISVLLFSGLLPAVFVSHPGARFRRLSLLLMILGCLSLLVSASTVFMTGGFVFEITLAGARLLFDVDWLSAFFVVVIGVVSVCVGIYSFSYMERMENAAKRNSLASLMPMFIASMAMVVASRHLVGFLIFWEAMSISSFLLVMLDYEDEETKKAGVFYFVMTQLSTVLLLFAFISIYSQTGAMELSGLALLTPPMASCLFVFLTLGFGIKAGAIPFHKWLPYAHPAAPSPVSALMSGVMIKIAIYGMLRSVLLMPGRNVWGGVLILALGTVSAFLGVIYALKEHDLKRLLAYHSIENIGIILIGVGLYVIFSSGGFGAIAMLALGAALFHTLNHALFKSLLFLGAGSVVQATGTKNIEDMGGLVRRMPWTASMFLVGAASISAIPPLNGFVSELMIFEAFLKTGVLSSSILKVFMFLSLSLFAMTSALAAACFVKAFGTVFLALPRSKRAASANETPLPMLAGQAVLAFLCVGLGVFSFQIFNVVGGIVGTPFPLPNLFWISSIGGVLLVIVLALTLFFGSRKSRISETWGCGIPSQKAKMEYTASGFSEPIVTIFEAIYRTKRINAREFHDSAKTVFKRGDAEIVLLKFFEKYLYYPVAMGVQRVSKSLYELQNRVEIDSYILYGFLAIVALIAVLGWIT